MTGEREKESKKKKKKVEGREYKNNITQYKKNILT